MFDIIKELKSLKLFGMAQSWAELSSAGSAGLPICEGLFRQLLEAETTENKK